MEKNKKYLLVGLCMAAAIGFLILNNETHRLRQELISEALIEKNILENSALFSASYSSSQNTTTTDLSKRNFLLCADSDGGIIPDVRGTISISYTFSNGKTKIRKFSDLSLNHQGASGIAEFYCEENRPKVKFIECEQESKGACASIPEKEADLLAISAGISSDGLEYSKRIVVAPEDPYISVNTPVYYKIVIQNLSSTESAETKVIHIPSKDPVLLGSVQNEEITCPSGVTCEGSLEGGITISGLFPSESVIITYERDISSGSASDRLLIEKYKLSTGDSDAVTLQIKD